ncbi:hypothetical protein GCM10010449_38500 [Streptomyces rectiviolaceus]|uniref:Uncharacterized protein n=1 Tax=Streptomyces rectiviolaceus TaxID=332591 RepID=A0ABP6MGL4_9ACTN
MATLLLFAPMSEEPTAPGQKNYQASIVEAQNQLFTGQLTHTNAKSLLPLAPGEEPALFTAEVRGTWKTGTPIDQYDRYLPVKAGAQLGVKLHCSGPGVRCEPHGAERKPVIRRSDRAHWSWDVSVKHPGKVRIALTATSYYRDSDSVLAETKPKIVSVIVPEPDPSTSSRITSAWQWLVGVVTSAAGLAAAVPVFVAAGAAVLARRRRSSQGAERTPSLRPRNPAGAVRTERYRQRRGGRRPPRG